MAEKSYPRRADSAEEIIIDAFGSNPEALESDIGVAAKILVGLLDRAVNMQSSLIIGYVQRLQDKYPEESPAHIQERMNKHFLRVATSTGAGVGATAAVPGIGFLVASAAVGAESLVFLDAAALYTMSSAYLRGADITDPERRRAFILVTLLGAKGTAVVDALVGDLAARQAGSAVSTTQMLNRLSVPTLKNVNNDLAFRLVNRATRRWLRGWVGKIMPLGIGAVAGTVANRRLAKDVITNVTSSLGPPPQQFPTALEAPQEEEQPEEVSPKKPRWKVWRRHS